MPGLRAPLGLIAILLACACGQPATDPSTAPEPGVQGQPADDQAGPAPGEGGKDQGSATASKPSELILGEWALELTPTQQRQYELLQLAFRNPPPTEQELAELALGPEEQLMIGMVLMGREQHPDQAASPQLHEGLEELASATLTITADSLTFAHGEDLDLAAYTVLSEETSTLQLETTTTVDGQPVVEKVNVQLDGTDRLQLWPQDDPTSVRQSFTRRGTASKEQGQDEPGDKPAPPDGQPPAGPHPGEAAPGPAPAAEG